MVLEVMKDCLEGEVHRTLILRLSDVERDSEVARGGQARMVLIT